METKQSSSNQSKLKNQTGLPPDCLEGFNDDDKTYEELFNTRFSDIRKFTPFAATLGMQMTSCLPTMAMQPLCSYPLCRPLATSTPCRFPPPLLSCKGVSPKSEVPDTALKVYVQNDSPAPDVLESMPEVVKTESNVKVETTYAKVNRKRSCEDIKSIKIDNSILKKVKYESVLTLHQLRSNQRDM